MQTKAALMVLVLLSGTIAGCTSDPDGGGNDGIDSDALDELFDQYFEDFVNNTTITVNNHYHNNTTYVVDDGDYSTTVVNEYNNTTINEGDETSTNNYNNQTDNDYSSSNSSYSFNDSGAGSGSIMQMFTVSWDIEELIGYDPAERIVTSGNGTLLYVTFYNGQSVEFRDLTCEEWWNYRYYSDEHWENFLRNNYGTDWEHLDNRVEDIRNHFYDNDNYGYDAEEQCDVDYWRYLGNSSLSDDSRVILYEIHLEEGQAMSYLLTTQYVTVDVNCDDGYGTGLGNGTGTQFIGGQANCTVTGSTLPTWKLGAIEPQMENGSQVSPDGYTLYEYGIRTNGGAPFSFAVYFTMHFVEVYDEGSE